MQHTLRFITTNIYNRRAFIGKLTCSMKKEELLSNLLPTFRLLLLINHVKIIFHHNKILSVNTKNKKGQVNPLKFSELITCGSNSIFL